MSDSAVLEVGGMQTPYFCTQEFSEVMLQNEQLMLSFAKAPEGSRAVFMTGSGTASMESVVANVLSEKDKAIVINGGSFGQRFVELCHIHELDYTEVKLDYGMTLEWFHLSPLADKGYTALLVNMGETLTGLLYDMFLISQFCKENGLLLIVDAISTFLADDFDIGRLGADIMITGSQKALACQLGISIVVLSPHATKVTCHKSDCYCTAYSGIA
jgi:aspartate aminotransferase-like enzyme